MRPKVVVPTVAAFVPLGQVLAAGRAADSVTEDQPVEDLSAFLVTGKVWYFRHWNIFSLLVSSHLQVYGMFRLV